MIRIFAVKCRNLNNAWTMIKADHPELTRGIGVAIREQFPYPGGSWEEHRQELFEGFITIAEKIAPDKPVGAKAAKEPTPVGIEDILRLLKFARAILLGFDGYRPPHR